MLIFFIMKSSHEYVKNRGIKRHGQSILPKIGLNLNTIFTVIINNLDFQIYM